MIADHRIPTRVEVIRPIRHRSDGHVDLAAFSAKVAACVFFGAWTILWLVHTVVVEMEQRSRDEAIGEAILQGQGSDVPL